MRLLDHFTRSGELLFRGRSYLPLLLVPLFVASFVGARYPFNSHALDLAWEIGCFLVSLTGFAIRLFTVGTAPHGTSGRNTREQKAEVLNTAGAYSVVRHPLYLGNYLIALGLSCFSRTWSLPIIVSLATLLYYERIAAREEEFLDEKFGEEFRSWAARVPAIVPNFRNPQPPALPFSWRKALGREFYGISFLGASFFVLDVIQEFAVTGRIAFDPLWTLLGVFSAVFFVTMRTLKKRTHLLKIRDDRPRVVGTPDPRR